MPKSTVVEIDGVLNKKCGTCGLIKPVAEFYPRADGRDGYRSECKVCWYGKNSARSNECHQRKNREEPERYQAQRRRTYVKARGEFIPCMRMALNVKKRQCMEKGIEFLLEPEDIETVYNEQDGKCALTDRELLWGLKGWHRDTLSIDRIEANVGYVVGNIRLITYQANRARGDLSDEEFAELCHCVLRKMGFQFVREFEILGIPEVMRPEPIKRRDDSLAIDVEL